MCVRTRVFVTFLWNLNKLHVVLTCIDRKVNPFCLAYSTQNRICAVRILRPWCAGGNYKRLGNSIYFLKEFIVGTKLFVDISVPILSHFF